jgi:hypothetical protein
MRMLDLPKEVHSKKLKVSFKNGILEVRLLKTEKTEPLSDLLLLNCLAVVSLCHGARVSHQPVGGNGR